MTNETDNKTVPYNTYRRDVIGVAVLFTVIGFAIAKFARKGYDFI